MKLKTENNHKMVMTTSNVLCNGAPVLSVLYDEDTDWQLFGEDAPDEEEAYLVSVEEILEMEPTLKQLPDMLPGQYAFWDKQDQRWIVEKEQD